MPLPNVRRKPVVMAGCAMLLASLGLAPVSEAAEKAPTYYRMTILDVYIVDIQGTLDNDACADVYGHLTLWERGEDDFQFPFQYFSTGSNNPVVVCEPNRPLNEGKQVGHLRNNRQGNWNKRFNLPAEGQHAYQFRAKLTDDDPSPNPDDLICNQSSDWIKPHDTRHVWSCKGPDTELIVEYSIDPVSGKTGNTPIKG